MRLGGLVIKIQPLRRFYSGHLGGLGHVDHYRAMWTCKCRLLMSMSFTYQIIKLILFSDFIIFYMPK